jgi:type IV conjugative transfer system coupling protein TraD
MNVIKTIAEGGQIWAHKIRMIRQVIKIAIMASMTVGIAIFVYKMVNVPSMYYQALWHYIKANLAGSFSDTVTVDKDFWEAVVREHYFTEVVTVKALRVSEVCEGYYLYLYGFAERSMYEALSLSGYAFSFFVLFFLMRGKESKKKKHVSGRKIEPVWKVGLKLKVTRKASDIRIGSLPLVKNTETQHLFVTGGTGSGKTNCFNHILPKIREKGQKAIIVDTTGTFISKYYREGKDLILNPFDPRSESWNPWVECRDPFDYDSLAQSFIPLSYHENENYWRSAAKTVFSAVLQKTEPFQKVSQLSKVLFYDPLPKLCEFVQGTKAASHLDLAAEKTASSIRSVMTSFLGSMEFLNDQGNIFSIRKWVEDSEDSSWLFLSSSVAQRTILNPLLSAWFSIAIRSLLQLEPDLARRLWFVVDELPSLHRLHDFETFLTESRKFGGCALLAAQSPAQLDMIYGKEAAKIITGNCSTKVAFFENDPTVAQGISKAFGEREIFECQEGISYGAHEMRDGVSLSKIQRMRPVVSVTDIQSLDKNEAFVKLPGKLPITKIKLKYV